MVLLVPQDQDGLSGLIRDLPYMSLPQISLLMEPTDVQLTMPRFTVDYSEDMVGPLRNVSKLELYAIIILLLLLLTAATTYYYCHYIYT